MRGALVAVVALAWSCTKPTPMSDASPGLVPVSQYVTMTDAGEAAHSISVVLDQQPAGQRSLLAISATEIVRAGTPERFAQPNVACPNQIVANCLITNCVSLRDVRSYPYGTVTPAAIGSIMVKGPNRSEAFSSDGGTRPQFVQSLTPMFEGGQVLKVYGASGATPPFERSLVVPRSIELLEPRVDSQAAPLAMLRAVPFQVRWSPLPAGAPERVAISVSDNVRTAVCRFDASAGVASVPMEVLTSLSAGPGFMTVHTLWAHDEAAQGWLVSVFARNVATQADGGTANFPTLELQ